MNHLKNLLAKLLLAVCMLGGAAQAGAAPMYSITIDTASLGGGQAYLGLYFLGLANAAPATATVGSLTGEFSGKPRVTGSVTGALSGPAVFSNADGGGELVRVVTLGGLLSFDVGFTLGAGDAGTTFGWALFDDSRYLGADGDLGTVSLQPGAAPGAMFVVDNVSALSHVRAVPEPSSVLLMLAGMLCVIAQGRRIGRPARTISR
ncbi:MAG TPA: NF038129 family PEP-CTERM protein [Duganella sp.]|nr:NF038129 family PEP-CTERM protein [Duganella sp.]